MEIKTRSFISLTLTFCLFLGCKQSSSIHGVWIGTNTVYGDSVIQANPISLIVSLEKDLLVYKTTGNTHDHFERMDSIVSTKYDLDNGRLYLKGMDEIISLEHFSKDSVLAFYQSQPNRKIIFNRIDKKNGYRKGVFNKKEFSYIGNNETENSILFINDSICVEFNKAKNIIEVKNWEVSNFKGHHFLVLNDEIGSLPFHIDATESRNIHLHDYSGSKDYLFQRYLPKDSIKNMLIGDWHFHEMTGSNTSIWPNKQKDEIIGSLSFGNDFISYENSDSKIREKKYILGGFGKILIFPEKPIIISKILKIEQLTTNELVLVGYTKDGQISTKVKYKKS